MAERLQSILDDTEHRDLGAVDMQELRSWRARCKAVETGLSYVRRLAQGRLDVVAAERSVRAEPGASDELGDVIARLPEVLASSTRTPGTGRPTSDFGPGEPDADLVAELDAIIAERHLLTPDELDDGELDAAQSQLEEFERRVSDYRRQLFDRLDRIEAELTRRYRTGEASVDSLLG